MVRTLGKVDRTFLILLIIILVFGLFIFLSASFGLLLNSGAKLPSIILNQIGSIVLGGLAAFLVSRINYKNFRRFGLLIFIFSVIINLLVWVPGFGFRHGGALRWIDIGKITFQPSEFLKIGFIIYLASWLSSARDNIRRPRFGIIPFAILVGLVAAIVLSQPDTATFLAIAAASLAMFVAAAGRLRDIFGLVIVAAIGFSVLVYFRPYLLDRLMTFVDPARDPQGSGYQIQQSLIAVGSGEFAGRGFGQSIQKFSYLPQPIDDSIFAVQAEEFGFVGSSLLVLLFVFFALRGFNIAIRAPDSFGGLLTAGIVILIVSQSFINIASMIGIMPLSGLPLIFVSHGGTAMFFALAEVGIVLGISRQIR
jgi:cell division protein FtsW